MKKLFLLLFILLGVAASRAEVWTPVGEAEWHEGILTCQASGFKGKSWKVIVEQSDERPKVLRCQPYSNQPTSNNDDNLYVYINAENPQRVYLDKYAYFYGYSSGRYYFLRVFQRCPENGFDSAYYGKIIGNTIEFPIGSFAVDDVYTTEPYRPGLTSPSSNARYSNEVHKIVLPEGVFEPQPESWVSIGDGAWLDAFSQKDESLPGTWNVAFEKSVDRDGCYRARPWGSDDAKSYYGDGGADAEAIICAENPDKVYLEKFELFGYEYSQVVPENGWSQGTSYGKMKDGEIVIPQWAFKRRPVSSEQWQNEFQCYRDLVINLPEDYFKTPSSSGVYFGITAFNYDPKIKPIELLSKNNKADFKRFVNEQTMDDATYLYYSADVAINALAERKYPDDLGSVALITFTDGNDDGSLEKADPSWNDADYQKHLTARLRDVMVQGLPVDAYSIGLKGEDISDYNYETFKTNLGVLASKPKQATEVSNMSEVESTINEILDNLERSWVNKKVSCSINMRATGDRIRFTLDKTREEMNNNPDNSEMWVEGTFSRVDNSLNDITYHGLTSTSGEKVVAEKVVADGKTKYKLTFENLRDLDGNVLETRNIEFWHRAEGSTAWQPHTEFKQGSDSGTETARTSAAIMFVMDCSDSLGKDFPELQRIVNALIDRLVPEGSSGVENIVIDSSDEDIDAPVEYYNMQGVRVENPTPGLYICRKGRKVTKVIIR